MHEHTPISLGVDVRVPLRSAGVLCGLQVSSFNGYCWSACLVNIPSSGLWRLLFLHSDTIVFVRLLVVKFYLIIVFICIFPITNRSKHFNHSHIHEQHSFPLVNYLYVFRHFFYWVISSLFLIFGNYFHNLECNFLHIDCSEDLLCWLTFDFVYGGVGGSLKHEWGQTLSLSLSLSSPSLFQYTGWWILFCSQCLCSTGSAGFNSKHWKDTRKIYSLQMPSVEDTYCVLSIFSACILVLLLLW